MNRLIFIRRGQEAHDRRMLRLVTVVLLVALVVLLLPGCAAPAPKPVAHPFLAPQKRECHRIGEFITCDDRTCERQGALQCT